MHNIATQIEDLYMNNSRNDMNDTIMRLLLESLVTDVMTPERLLIEHIVLISILHANVGTEVGEYRKNENFEKDINLFCLLHINFISTIVSIKSCK